MPALMFGSWVLNEIWIIDLSSVLVGMLMCPSKLVLFFFSNEAHLNSGVRLLLELYSVIVICCYLWEINNDIHIYQFTFKLLFPDVVK